jgi:hypothetical protein
MEIAKRRTLYRVIGDGIEVLPSSIGPSAGLGLFISSDALPDEAITVYDGTLVATSDLPRFNSNAVSCILIVLGLADFTR